MRVVIATMKHETNTFSPIVTDWARFENWGVYRDYTARSTIAGTAMPMAAYLRLAEAEGAEISTPIHAEAMPAGPVTTEAYERLCTPILEEISRGCDLALLDLHGAMVAETTDDGEGTLLKEIRRIAPDLPIAVTCDLHCNLTADMVENCTALIGYKTYPHEDMYDVADQVGRIVFSALKGECDPVMAWRQPPLLSQTLRQGTDDSPMRELMDRCRMLEQRPEILAATVFGGFALADMKDAGSSTIVVADRDRAAAAGAARALADQCWAARADFLHQHSPLEEAVARAKEITDGPVVLLDHADNCGSGATQDSMTVIAEVLRQGLSNVAIATVWDPAAVTAMQEAGIGAEVTLDLGGHTDMPSIGLGGHPLWVTGRVENLTDGKFKVEGPMYTGMEVAMGPTAVLRTGQNMRIVITSLHHEPWDAGVFTSTGIDPATCSYLLLKSRIHYRAGFRHLERHRLTLDGTGVTTSDNDLLTYRKVRRPIYPLDEAPGAPVRFPED